MKTSFFQIYRHPYAFDASISGRFSRFLFFGTFIFLFLLIFQPFGLHAVGHYMVLITAGYGLCTFFALFLLSFTFYPLFTGYFNDETWTVGRELFWISINILAIGCINLLYSYSLGLMPFSIKQFISIQLFTLSVALIPISLMVFYKEARLKKRNHKSAEQLNARINSVSRNQTYSSSKTKTEIAIQIPSQNAKENFEVNVNEILYITSSDNYIEVFYIKDKEVLKTLIRNSLKALELQLKPFPELLRCHKSYIVNLKRVIHVSGNAQGYKLHIKGCKQLLPVSRNYNELLKTGLSIPV